MLGQLCGATFNHAPIQTCDRSYITVYVTATATAAAAVATALLQCYEHRSFYHELLVAGYSAHNVFSNGFGSDLTLDHHGGVPHNNLWTNIDLVGCGRVKAQLMLQNI